MFIRRAFEHGAYQSRVEPAKEAQCFDGRLATRAQGLGLGIRLEDALVFTQGVLYLVVAGQGLCVGDTESFGRLYLRVMKIANAVFTHQARRFLGDKGAVTLRPVLCVDLVVLASCHDSPPCGVYVYVRRCRRRGPAVPPAVSALPVREDGQRPRPS